MLTNGYATVTNLEKIFFAGPATLPTTPDAVKCNPGRIITRAGPVDGPPLCAIIKA
jgi:hypothetical protein